MAAKKSRGSGDRNDNRPSGKAAKKTPKVFDPVKRRLVSAK